MSSENSQKRSLDDFQRWRVNELKIFLRARGLKTSGTKNELAALAFSAEEIGLPLVCTPDEKDKSKKIDYRNLLSPVQGILKYFCQCVLP